MVLNNIDYAQRQGTDVPSVAASMIEALPDEEDERFAEEEKIAQDTAATAYTGKI
jgi:hypothetical protein